MIFAPELCARWLRRDDEGVRADADPVITWEEQPGTQVWLIEPVETVVNVSRRSLDLPAARRAV
jgi:hypothetical protein